MAVRWIGKWRIAILSGVLEATRSDRHQCNLGDPPFDWKILVSCWPGTVGDNAYKETKSHWRERESDTTIVLMMEMQQNVSGRKGRDLNTRYSKSWRTRRFPWKGIATQQITFRRLDGNYVGKRKRKFTGWLFKESRMRENLTYGLTRGRWKPIEVTIDTDSSWCIWRIEEMVNIVKAPLSYSTSSTLSDTTPIRCLTATR